jgi:tetratricopeptide (TPR) repeat protein
MKTPLIIPAVVFLMFCVASHAQGRPGSGGTGGTGGSKPTNPTNPLPSPGTRTSNPFPETDHPIFLTGKVVLPDGSPVAESVTIESVCGGRKRVETYTDSHGNFSFELKKKANGMAIQSADMGGAGDSPLSSKGNVGDAFQYRNCELQASLPGFTSEVVQIAESVSSMIESTDVGRIVIHPLGGSTASVLSATSLAAPGSAKKAMDKARELEKKNKTEDAEKSLQKAVDIYPQYAAAWTELGRLQYANHDTAGAQHSFQQAVAADPKYASPYLGLAQIEAQASHWQNAVELTNKLLAMNSGYAVAWLIQGVGQYNLQQFDTAETSLRSGLKVDQDHRYPRLEHLLGLILVGKKDYVQAAEHMRAFVKYSTQPTDQAEGQKLLAEIEKRSAQANLGTESPK